MALASAEPIHPPAPVTRIRLSDRGARRRSRSIPGSGEALRRRNAFQSGEAGLGFNGAVKVIVGPGGEAAGSSGESLYQTTRPLQGNGMRGRIPIFFLTRAGAET